MGAEVREKSSWQKLFFPKTEVVGVSPQFSTGGPHFTTRWWCDIIWVLSIQILIVADEVETKLEEVSDGCMAFSFLVNIWLIIMHMFIQFTHQQFQFTISTKSLWWKDLVPPVPCYSYYLGSQPQGFILRNQHSRTPLPSRAEEKQKVKTRCIHTRYCLKAVYYLWTVSLSLSLSLSLTHTHTHAHTTQSL